MRSAIQDQRCEEISFCFTLISLNKYVFRFACVSRSVNHLNLLFNHNLSALMLLMWSVYRVKPNIDPPSARVCVRIISISISKKHKAIRKSAKSLIIYCRPWNPASIFSTNLFSVLKRIAVQLSFYFIRKSSKFLFKL